MEDISNIGAIQNILGRGSTLVISYVVLMGDDTAQFYTGYVGIMYKMTTYTL